jgi:hypothetical protein
MKQTTLLCWRLDYNEDEGEKVSGPFLDAEDAACEYVKQHFYDWEYPMAVAVKVQAEGGVVTIVDVEVESVPHFYGRTRKEKFPEAHIKVQEY